MSTRPTAVKISAEDFQTMISLLAKDPTSLLLFDPCRQYLARKRWKGSGGVLEIFEEQHEGTMPGTVAHNRREAEMAIFGSSRRTQRLINPLSALEPVYSRASELKVLSIGPRTEMEIFHLMAVGFQVQNIRALDLISSSPLIDAGDMHELPYADRSFDVVISGWVIAYSNTPQRAVDEIIRVCADGGLVAIGLTYENSIPEGSVSKPRDEKDIVGTNFGTVAQIQKLFGSSLDSILFQQDPGGNANGPVMMIARLKHT